MDDVVAVAAAEDVIAGRGPGQVVVTDRRNKAVAGAVDEVGAGGSVDQGLVWA